VIAEPLAAVTTAVAVWVVVVLLAFGRREVTHPAVAFGAAWFGCVALAQLRLTTFEQRWSQGFAVLVVSGGAVFVVAALFMGGVSPVRGSFRIEPSALRIRRLLLACYVLLPAALFGLAWKASILGGIPLLSGRIDVLRMRAYTPEAHVPGWVTLLSNGFHLTFWIALAILYVGQFTLHRSTKGVVYFMAAVSLFGVSAGGSRNAILFALLVPTIVAYLLTGTRLPRRYRRLAFASALVALVSVTAFSLVRMHQGPSALNRFVTDVAGDNVAHDGALLMYMGATFGLETERRLVAEVPARESYTSGTASLQLLPDVLFPNGKPSYDKITSQLTRDRDPSPHWTIATYQGRAFLDFGFAGVLVVSAVLGLVLGLAYRLARGGTWLVLAVVAAYATYYAAFLPYENLLSVNPTFVYDIVVLALVERVARREPDEVSQGTMMLARIGYWSESVKTTVTERSESTETDALPGQHASRLITGAEPTIEREKVTR
jgi:oligosaccharide repeat unit polymerase